MVHGIRATVSSTPFRLRPAVIAGLAIALSAVLPGNGAARQQATTPKIGPRQGALIVAGGGRLGPEIMDRFIDLAGGANARIVIIPTAGEQEEFADDWSGYEPFRSAGVKSVKVLHTRDPKVADTESFAAPLRDATGVWIPGGRQWRLADSYLETRTLRALNAVLERGGVIGGSSAGASIQASYMVRGAVEGNTVMMAEGHERGFGFLRGVAVDQHILVRGRENDMLQVVEKHPDLLGIGLDEGTAILVRGDAAEVIGRSKAAFYNTRDADGEPYYFLEAGDVFDLAARSVRYGTRLPARTAAEREAVSAVQSLFDAMRARDAATVRAAFHPDARLYVPLSSGDSNTIRVMTATEFATQIGNSPQPPIESFRDPDVRVDGNLASVWTYYEFRRGDQFSHCGTDAFQLARTDSGWKIIQIAYTVRQEGCRR
jgi:cyanophycinase